MTKVRPHHEFPPSSQVKSAGQFRISPAYSTFITKRSSGYDRNHGPIPILDPANHRVTVDGAVRSPLSLSIHDLASAFPQHAVTCALQCAGNRRHSMRTFLKEVQGIDWGDGAVMNVAWRGPRLKDVLERAGVDVEHAAHVAFACDQQPVQDDDWYGGSIPLERGLSEEGDVILALEMNGEKLPPKHGAPVRIIAPGIAGARSVKWLSRITVQATESHNHYQKRDYKILPPEAGDADAAERYWDSTPALQDMPINSIVGVPRTGSKGVKLDADGKLLVKGYALPQGMSGPVVRVEVSGDQGRSWVDAEIEGDGGKWSWVLWTARVRVEPGEGRRVLSRATDKGGNTQAEKPAWNLRGVAYDGYGEARDLTVVE